MTDEWRSHTIGDLTAEDVTESQAGTFKPNTGALATCAYACDVQSRTLAAIRVTRLPKPVSGELRVKDAERIAARYT